MYQAPRPHYGYAGVTAAFLAYVSVVVAVGVGLSRAVAPAAVAIAGALATAVALLSVTVPVFCRVAPERADRSGND